MDRLSIQADLSTTDMRCVVFAKKTHPTAGSLQHAGKESEHRPTRVSRVITDL